MFRGFFNEFKEPFQLLVNFRRNMNMCSNFYEIYSNHLVRSLYVKFVHSKTSKLIFRYIISLSIEGKYTKVSCTRCPKSVLGEGKSDFLLHFFLFIWQFKFDFFRFRNHRPRTSSTLPAQRTARIRVSWSCSSNLAARCH